LHIAKKLRDGSLIETHIGTHGGYTLNTEASCISVYDVIFLLEGDTHIPNCMNNCDCNTLYSALFEMKNCMDTYFKALTFDQMAKNDMSGKNAEILSLVEDVVNL